MNLLFSHIITTARAFAFIIILIQLVACAENMRPSNEVGPEGEKSLAIEDPEQQKLVREDVYRGVVEGLSSYQISPGDIVEVLYLSSNTPQQQAYRIVLGDKLLIQFHYTGLPPVGVVVRPDGMITVPYKGDVMAAGVAPPELAKQLEAAFVDIYNEPRVTVAVTEFTSRLDDLRETLSSVVRGGSQKFTVSPDGMVYLPYLNGLHLAGMDVDSARDLINEEYREGFGGIDVSLLLDTVVGNRVFVFGEVASPGVLKPVGQYTVLQALASAGGHLPTGSLSNIKVLYWSHTDSQPRLRTVNLARVLGEQRLEEDILLPPNATIYVPPKGITKANRFVDQYLRKLFMFNGVNMGINYEIDK